MTFTTIPVNLSSEDFEDLYDMAGYVIGYWASATVKGDDSFRVMEDETKEIHTVTRSGLLQAAAEVIAGKHDISERIRQCITTAFVTSDMGELDGYDVDALVQIACFKEIVYG